MEKRTRPIYIDPRRRYYAVSLIETIGAGPAAVNIKCIIHDVPADNAPEACRKALVMYMRKNGLESEPKLHQCELEDYSRPIRIRQN